MIGKRIKYAREKLNMSQEELASKVGYKSRSSINKIELGLQDVQQKKVPLFANVLNVSIGYLMGDDTKEIRVQGISKQSIPMLGTISCGLPIYADEERESYVLEGTNIRADFCLRCEGDSMINARINSGDIVFIRKQDIVNNGEIAAVIIDDEATLKRFYYFKDQNMVILRAENPKYKDIILIGEQLDNVKVIGKAIAFQSDAE
ncbi:MAG: helix-turn-helix domain-containing protein [Holdemanella sp.]|nr:helix-turn-helix domain-containing protein [Holdemanella sp.]